MLVGYWGDFIKGQDCPTCQRIVKHFQRATKDVTPEWIIVIAKVGHKENQFYIRLVREIRFPLRNPCELLTLDIY